LSLYLAARYPTGREDAKPAQESFSNSALSTLNSDLVSASPDSGCTSTCQARVKRD
jgi:hypothetical protein